MSLFKSKLATIGLLVITGFLLISVLKLVPAIVITNKEVSNLKSQLVQYDNLNKIASGQEEYFNSDDYLQQQAKLKLNYKNPDEKVVYFYKKGVEENTDQKPVLQTWWQKIISWFKK